MGTFSWIVEDSTVFFILNQSGDVYKLVFTLWEGSSSGYFEFNTELMQPSAISDELEKQHLVSVYPNPATEFTVINISNDISFDGEIIISDLSGRVVYKSILSNSGGNASVTISTNDFVKGLYFITLISDDLNETRKLVVR